MLRRARALGWWLPLATMLAGCANVSPSQRRHLASDVMNLDDAALERTLQDHMLQYREGSVGGNGGGGSGCGCN